MIERAALILCPSLPASNYLVPSVYFTFQTDTRKKRAQNNLEARISRKEKKKISKRFPSKEFSSRDDYRSGKLPRQFTNMPLLDSLLLLLLFISLVSIQEWNEKNYDSYPIETENSWRKFLRSVDFKVTLTLSFNYSNLRREKFKSKTRCLSLSESFSTDSILIMDLYSENRFAVQKNTVDSNLGGSETISGWDIIFQPSIIPLEIRRIKKG